MAGNLLDVNVALVICELICCMGSIWVRKGMVCGLDWRMTVWVCFGW